MPDSRLVVANEKTHDGWGTVPRVEAGCEPADVAASYGSANLSIQRSHGARG
ncbi:hypothetical protein SAMN06264365_104528 [Actinoplanes regularis]|uniref:Uncharacterized protein n=1 Tax=Actinoplanes regularis TaxID=52697 RepID=A0A238YH44_9ACTN|nr:hypothetical protein SAMN06264365_104528 [Actinoplanes regularis]